MGNLVNIRERGQEMVASGEITQEQLDESLKIYDETDIFLLRLDKVDKKHVRRAEAINGTGRLQDIGPMKILGYFGDAYHDFPDESNTYIFGKNMFMFPNPMYGKW